MGDSWYWTELLRTVFAGQLLIFVAESVAAVTSHVHFVRRLGAGDVMVVAAGLGTGDLPEGEGVRWVVFDSGSSEQMETYRSLDRLVEQPPRELVSALEVFDPERTACIVLPAISGVTGPSVLQGRPLWTSRTERSLSLEDKTRVDALWDAAGVTRAPSVVIPPVPDELRRAVAETDRGSGTVWSADIRDGVLGGGAGVRWVRSDTDFDEALLFFSERCDRVRVMSFLEGVACGIHGIVFLDQTISLRPVEIVMLRAPSSARFRYAGTATFWDPPEGQRGQMRDVVQRVGDLLRRQIGFRGAFTVDGISTSDGFLPTELNPRYGAGLSRIGASTPALSLPLLNMAVTRHDDLDFRPLELERLLISSADGHRTGESWLPLPQRRSRTERHTLVCDSRGRLGLGRDRDDQVFGLLTIGPAPTGSLIRFTPAQGCVRIGCPLAPVAVRAFAFADQALGTSIGVLQSASVRTEPVA